MSAQLKEICTYVEMSVILIHANALNLCHRRLWNISAHTRFLAITIHMVLDNAGMNRGVLTFINTKLHAKKMH